MGLTNDVETIDSHVVKNDSAFQKYVPDGLKIQALKKQNKKNPYKVIRRIYRKLSFRIWG